MLGVSIVTNGTSVNHGIYETYGLSTDQSIKSLKTWFNWNHVVDLRVFGRYQNIDLMWLSIVPKLFKQTYREVYITQDDDCILSSIQPFLDAYTPGVVTCNVPVNRRAEYNDGVALVGWGAIFDRGCMGVFRTYLKHYPMDDLFLTECDRVFTGLNRVQLIDVPFTHLPHAEDADRLHKRHDHWERLREIRRRIYRVKDLEGLPK